MRKQKILIVGNGNIGGAIYHLLNSNSKNKNFLIEIFDKDPEKNKSKKTLKDSARDADFVFLCIPSWTEEEALLEIYPSLKKGVILITLSKGINMTSQKSMDELLDKDAESSKYALLSGPMFATEIIEGKPSYAILASKEKSVFKKVSALFAETNLWLEYSKEVHSVAFSAVLKNIYALLFGIVDSFKESNNTKGFLASKSFSEIREIMKMLKLDPEISLGISGLGDFIATAESQYSQNRKAGIEIYKNGSTVRKSEGLVSLPILIKKLGKKSAKLPLLSLIEKIVIKKHDAKKELEKFFKEI